MTPVSKRKLNEETEKLLKDLLLSSLKDLNKNELKGVLESLLTETELKMLIKRAGIIMLLNNDITLDQITKATKTTPQTVIRIKLLLQTKPDKDKKVLLKRLDNCYKLEKVKEILQALYEIESPSKSIRNAARKITGI
ncbi:hypothetical protein A2Z22_03935 [Candidatus Woesebacteria bacterium RBG_16_34_12]|uniref:Uncharacterized protein n=1 Tax=Candidatus Woesebacteria bacterium RBG_16_34_12 TaxID=1802480 RepID=A0A1F7X883_9BACT|nr:MAG: hypothetical protein A2Z22_03935 [Candidatus Woesebacteria bacterium RBG_16_34_12]